MKEYFMNNHKIINSPVGKLTLIADESSLLAVLWEVEKEGRVKLDWGKKANHHPILEETEKQLTEYFNGERSKFSLPVKFQGTTFQNSVWKALQKIPFGQTMSYGEIAHKVGSPKASRAVGTANGKNPLSIVIPCHRVIGSSGKLTGFAGGISAKETLLDLELEK
jgi:methylated-DNA-[protein]-cysteine S-methyltransferase